VEPAEAIRQCDGNTEDAEVWRGRLLLFLGGLGAPADVQARAHVQPRVHTRAHTERSAYAQARGSRISSLGGVAPQCP
jgi:hypothetical protein